MKVAIAVCSMAAHDWIRRGALQACPQHSVESGRGHLVGLGKSKPAVTSAQYVALCKGVMVGPAANLTPLAACANASVVVPSTVDASAVKVHPPDERMSNASAIGRSNAVFRLMCCVPRMSSIEAALPIVDRL